MNRITAAAIALVLCLFAGSVGKAAQLRQQLPPPTITSASTTTVRLTPGGSEVQATFQGTNLNLVASPQALLNGVVSANIQGRIVSQTTTSATIAWRATATAAAGTYAVRVMWASCVACQAYNLDIPGSVFAVTVAAARPTGLPYISTWTRSPVMVNSEIKFYGRDLVPEYFAARIGTQPLNITYRSATEIRAVCPQRVTGDLIVGYGTAATEFALEPSYRVMGDPVIRSVSPTSFTLGDTVTISGTDLDGATLYKRYGGSDPVTYGYMKLSDQSGSVTGSDFVRIEPLQNSAETLTFKVYEAYGLSSAIQPLSPQPTALTGRLRLVRRTGTAEFTVASPSSVTFRGLNEFTVTKVGWQVWPGTANFIILAPTQSQSDNVMAIEGRGLFPSTNAVLGSTQLLTSLNADGRGGLLTVPVNAQPGPIVFTRDNLRAESNFVNVIPPPTFTPETNTLLNVSSPTTPVRIVLNTRYRLQGWYLQASGTSGLTYEFTLSYLSSQSYLRLNVYSHSASLIEFSVDRVGDLPSTYQSSNLFGETATSAQLILKAKYGSNEKVLFSRPYVLRVQ